MDRKNQVFYVTPDEAFGLWYDWDVAGHFHLHVRLREDRHASWSVTSKVELELGALDALARRVSMLVAANP
jgi:hypothetical protein